MRLIKAVATGASIASVTATEIYGMTSGGQPQQFMFNQSDLTDLYSPDSTNSVKFTFGREEWTWRVNVTSLSVPDARLSLDSANGPPLPDPRVIVTTYDLQWPNASSTLNETAIRLGKSFGAGGQASADEPICMAVVENPIWPNVTNKLTDSADGDCEAVLGPECAAALMSERLQGGRCGTTFLDVEACRDVFSVGNQQTMGRALSKGSYSDDGPTSNVSHAEPTHSGDGIWFASGDASARPNSTALRQAESQLRVMLLSLPNTRALVCTRVDPSIDDVDVSPVAQRDNWDGDKPSGGSGDGGDGDGDDGDDSSAARPRVAATVGVVGLAIAVFGLL